MDEIKIKKIIKDTLGLNNASSSRLNESYVAQAKQYEINTEMILSKTKDAHFELYENYVDTLNNLSAELDTVDKKAASAMSSEYRSLKLDEQYNMNAVYLHELFFANIGDPYSEIAVDSLAYIRLSRDFGTFENYQRDLIACGMATREGWVITGYSFYLQRYVNCIIDGHDQSSLVGIYPVLTIDLFYHARRDYLNKKKEYIIAMMKELNWEIIDRRVQKAEAISEIIGGVGKQWI